MVDQHMTHIDFSNQEKLYKACYSYGITVALYYVGNREDALYVYNDAFIKIFKSDISQIDNFKAWFRRIVVNTAIDFNRKYFSKPETVEIIDFLPSDEINALDTLKLDDLIRIVNTIPPSYKTVFLMHVVDGFTFIEIATQLGITEGGAKSLFYKGQKKLQHIISSKYSEYEYKRL
jgi:RNA polymerase sigma-70 factor, ECF subfamily